MRVAKQKTQSTAEFLNEEIRKGVRMQQAIERLDVQLKALKDGIKGRMQEAELSRFAASNGAEALLIDQAVLSFRVPKLAEVLGKADFERLCPRKPDSEELRAFIKSADPALSVKVLLCAKKSNRTNLELRPPAQVDQSKDEVKAEAKRKEKAA